MTRWLVAGAHGMLGRDLVEVLDGHGDKVTAPDRHDLDVRSPASCAAAVDGHDVVVNCAAYTAVDAAEDDEQTAFALNAVGAANLATAAAAVGARTVQISTDYVFDGQATSPYSEDAAVAPRSAYGRTKAAGEWAVLAADPLAMVVRTSWLYGARGASFVSTMLRLADERTTVAVVDDQRGSPTWTVDLAEAIRSLVNSGAAPGTWHATGGGDTTWFGFARAVFEGAGLDPQRVQPTTTLAFPRPAPRPTYSVLGHRRWTAAGLPLLRNWRAALDQALPVIQAAIDGPAAQPGMHVEGAR